MGAFQVEQEFAHLDVSQDDVVLIHQGRVLPRCVEESSPLVFDEFHGITF